MGTSAGRGVGSIAPPEEERDRFPVGVLLARRAGSTAITPSIASYGAWCVCVWGEPRSICCGQALCAGVQFQHAYSTTYPRINRMCFNLESACVASVGELSWTCFISMLFRHDEFNRRAVMQVLLCKEAMLPWWRGPSWSFHEGVSARASSDFGWELIPWYRVVTGALFCTRKFKDRALYGSSRNCIQFWT
jgi:hypothetical protein